MRRAWQRPWFLLAFAGLLLCGRPTATAPLAPRVFVVQTTDDKVTGQDPLSLREALLAASASLTPSMVFVPSGEYALGASTGTAGFGSGELPVLGGNVQILGSGVGATIIRAVSSDRAQLPPSLLHVYPGAQLALTG